MGTRRMTNSVINFWGQQTSNATGQRRYWRPRCNLTVLVHGTWDKYEEARFIGEQINGLLGADPKNRIAVLYRKHHQSGPIERSLRLHGIKYAVRGGTGFYDKKEIMDIIAYLKLAHCPTDSYSVGRIYNEPPRGIGDETMRKIRGAAKDRGTNVWEVINEMVNSGELSKQTEAALVGFIGLINSLRKLAKVSTPTENA